MSHFLDHLADDAMPAILDGWSRSRVSPPRDVRHQEHLIDLAGPIVGPIQ
jgi:hypothetical protein